MARIRAGATGSTRRRQGVDRPAGDRREPAAAGGDAGGGRPQAAGPARASARRGQCPPRHRVRRWRRKLQDANHQHQAAPTAPWRVLLTTRPPGLAAVTAGYAQWYPTPGTHRDGQTRVRVTTAPSTLNAVSHRGDASGRADRGGWGAWGRWCTAGWGTSGRGRGRQRRYRRRWRDGWCMGGGACGRGGGWHGPTSRGGGTPGFGRRGPPGRAPATRRRPPHPSIPHFRHPRRLTSG